METICLTCHQHLKEHESALGQKIEPRKGDISVCFYCGTVYVLEEMLVHRKMTTEEYQQLLEADPETAMLVDQIGFQIRMRNGKN